MKGSITLFFFLFLALIERDNCFITWIEKRFPLQGTPSPPGSPWPMPQKWEKSTKLVVLDPREFNIGTNASNCDVVEKAIERYKNYIFPDKKIEENKLSLPVLKNLRILVRNGSCSKYPSLDSDEKYELTVSSKINEAVILAESIWGILRGLETFSQLVWQNEDQSYVMNETAVTDFPRYQHRGILLDTARHFQPMSVIKKNLDAMEWNKMNVFHWHIVDDQSFPFESHRFPNLTTQGAYSPFHVYSQKNIAEVIDYARLRGIRVVFEFDTPGHTMGFGRAFPQLLTPCYGDGKTPGTPDYSVPHSDYEILDPTNNFTYWFMEEFFSEIRNINKDEYIHLGMDEVYYGCWKSSPKIKEFMIKHKYTEISHVEQHYVKWLIKMMKDKGFKYLTYQDPIDNNVDMDPNTIVQVWQDTELDKNMTRWQDNIIPIAEKGYKIILSACWYLNYISYGIDWKKYYLCDPKNFNGTEEQKKLVIGGEACMWGEYVDGTNLLSRLWPRASAVAERLWSAQEVNNPHDAAFRLDEHRCRMLRRGIPAQPILNGFCGPYEWEMGMENKMEGNSACDMKMEIFVIVFFLVICCLY